MNHATSAALAFHGALARISIVISPLPALRLASCSVQRPHATKTSPIQSRFVNKTDQEILLVKPDKIETGCSNLTWVHCNPKIKHMLDTFVTERQAYPFRLLVASF